MSDIKKMILSRVKNQFFGVSGFFLLRKILEKNKGKVVIFMNGLGIGDVCVQTTYLKSYQECHAKGKNDILIVCHQPCVDVAVEMGWNQVVGLTAKQIRDVAACYHSFLKGYCDYKIKTGCLIITDIFFYVNKWASQYIENLLSLNIIRDAALQLYDYPCVQTFPVVNADYRTVAEKFGISEPFVIVNPYSNSMNLDLKPFAAIAKTLSQAGIHVYCNVVGNQEPVEGSFPLKCSVHEFYALSGGAEAIVSIRSGILDYCIANMKKVFCMYDGWQFFRIHTLKAWNTDAEIYEYRYEGEKNAAQITAEIAGKILEDYQNKNSPRG